MYNPNFSEIPNFTRSFGVTGQNTVNGNSSPQSGISPINKIPVLAQNSSLPDIYSYAGVPVKMTVKR